MRAVLLGVLLAGCARGGAAPKAGASSSPSPPPTAAASRAELIDALTSPSGRFIALVRGGEVVVVAAADLTVVAKQPIGDLISRLGYARGFDFLGDDLLCVTHLRHLDGGDATEQMLIALPSGRVVARGSVDPHEGKMVVFRHPGPPAVELIETEDAKGSDAPHTFTLSIEGGEGRRRTMDLTGAARRAVGEATVVVVADRLVGGSLVVAARSTTGSRFDSRVGVVVLKTGEVTFFPAIMGPGADFTVTGSTLVGATGPDRGPFFVDLRASVPAPRTLRLPNEARAPKADPMGPDMFRSTCTSLEPSLGIVVLGDSAGPTRWLDTRSGKLLGTASDSTFETDTRVGGCTVRLSSDGQRVVTFAENGFVASADVKTGQLGVVRDDGDASGRGGALGNMEFHSAAVLSASGAWYAVGGTASARGAARTRVVDLVSGAVTELAAARPIAFARGDSVLLADDGVWSLATRQRIADVP